MFHTNFSRALVGKTPTLVSIDGGLFSDETISEVQADLLLGIVQTIQGGFDYNGESNMDLQYAMHLVNLVESKQGVTLYQVGDIPQGFEPQPFRKVCFFNPSYRSIFQQLSRRRGWNLLRL